MKKIISVVLLLAMCIACFAGCAPKEDANLDAAKEYLYTMYKDSKATTDSDYTVVSQVRINDVIYPITWTTDKAENVQIVAGENNMTTVKITAGAEDVNYKLIATMKNADGLEVSVSFDHIIPAKAQLPSTIVLAYPKENKYVTGGHYLYTGKNKWQLVISENKADAIALTVKENSDGTVTFVAGNYYLFCDATHVQFVTEESDNTKFVLEAADTEGGYYIKCAVANYGGKAQYLEVYSGYLTCYGMGTDPSIYVFKMEAAEGASGTVSGLEASAPETNTPPATNPPATNPPATNPPAASTGDTVTLDFTSLDKKGVEITAEEALALFNGTTTGNPLTAVSCTKIYNGNSTGGAHPDAAGFIRCGKSDANGELVLTFSKNVAKVEILCHDWYAKSEQYPTNNHQVAINGGTPQLAPYNETGAPASMVFELDGSSNVVDFDFSSLQSGKTGRVFIYKIIVTFA